MMKMRNLITIFYICVLSFFQLAYSQVRLPRLISDGMVLQRDTDVNIWGWAAIGEEILIDFMDETYHTNADENGQWTVKLPASPAGGPYTMEIFASNHIVIEDIVVGDVWICSGQSNMDLTMERVKERYPDVIANSENPIIRRFLVPVRYDFNTARDDLSSGFWESANPQSVLGFTATGYFFAKALFEKYQVPIGLIHASVGGSPAEAWLSADALKAFPVHLETAMMFKDSAYVNQIIEHDRAVSSAWYHRVRQLDEGFKDSLSWFDPAYNASDWKTMPVPSFWDDEGLGAVNGVVWFRKEIYLPVSMADRPAKLFMGRIVDSDSVYVNGQFVGSVSYQYPPRRYVIPKHVLKAGKNLFVVRVVNTAGRGGFIKDKPYELTAGGETIDLTGEWQYRLGAIMYPLPGQTFIRWKPLGLYNGMINPLIRYTIKGAIWYQGESNAGRAEEYRTLFPALITDWRQKWNQGNFPFLYVQLHNFMEIKADPSESDWAELREAQLKTLSVPNTAMAVAIDIGEWNDIHPLNKEDVGKRLALAAQKVAYGDDHVVYSGPIYQSMKIKRNRIILSFSNTGSGLIAKGGGDLKHFAVAGPDHKFIWAKAQIKGDKVVVWNDNIAKPVAVRYAWADNPETANLYNKEGLPASPFQAGE